MIFRLAGMLGVEIGALGEFMDPISRARYIHTHDSISPATGSVHIALSAALMDNYGMGGRDWISRFISGAPLVVYLIQRGVYGTTDKPLATAPHIDSIFVNSDHRYRERASHPAIIDAHSIGGGFLVRRGFWRPDGPYDLAGPGLLVSDSTALINIAIRYPAI